MTKDYIYEEVTTEEFINNAKKMPCLNCLVGMLCVATDAGHIRLNSDCFMHTKWAEETMFPIWERIPLNHHSYYKEVFRRIVEEKFVEE